MESSRLASTAHGSGLAISKGLVQLMGEKYGESTADAGLDLSFQNSRFVRPRCPGARSSFAEPTFAGLRILVVERSPGWGRVWPDNSRPGLAADRGAGQHRSSVKFSGAANA